MNQLVKDYNNAQISNNVLKYNFPHAWKRLTKDLDKKAFLTFVDEFHVGTFCIKNEEEFETAVEKFEDCFHGVFKSGAEFAEEFFENVCGFSLETTSLDFSLYIDWDAVWREQFCCNWGYNSIPANKYGSEQYIFSF